MPTILPYLNFQGKSQEATSFYKSIFGGEATLQINEGSVIHFEFVAEGIHFMGADHSGDASGVGRADDTSLVLTCGSEQQLTNFYSKLSAGGKEIVAPIDSGWGAIIAHCTDRFGVSWMLNYDISEPNL